MICFTKLRSSHKVISKLFNAPLTQRRLVLPREKLERESEQTGIHPLQYFITFLQNLLDALGEVLVLSLLILSTEVRTGLKACNCPGHAS